MHPVVPNFQRFKEVYLQGPQIESQQWVPQIESKQWLDRYEFPISDNFGARSTMKAPTCSMVFFLFFCFLFPFFCFSDSVGYYIILRESPAGDIITWTFYIKPKQNCSWSFIHLQVVKLISELQPLKIISSPSIRVVGITHQRVGGMA